MAAAWLRFASLDRLSFWADEYPHAIAARSLIHEGRPRLPSGREYRRALPQTLAVAASMRAFGENERAARLPSAFVGLATIPILWLVVRRRFSETAGLAAAAALTVMPIHVAHSRSARFYAAFVLAYGLAAALASSALEKRSLLPAVLAAVALGAALLLQVSAIMIAAPLALQAVWMWYRATSEERRVRGRMLVMIAGAAALFAIVMVSIPSLRGGSLRLLRDPVPGLRFSPGVHLGTLARPFDVVSWWAWIFLAPLAALGLRRAGRSGGFLLSHLLVPLALVAVLFQSTRSTGIGGRYLLHLVPFVATVVGIGCAEGVRVAASVVRAFAQPAAVAVAGLSISGVIGVWGMPAEAHPSTIIPRPNWNAAGAVIRAHGAPGDGLLSTGPLPMSWAAGRCGEWLRSVEAAAPYMVAGRDVYCGSRLIPNAAALADYLAAHPRGWVVADPRQWPTLVDPAVRASIVQTAKAVDVGDPSILVFRWGEMS